MATCAECEEQRKFVTMRGLKIDRFPLAVVVCTLVSGLFWRWFEFSRPWPFLAHSSSAYRLSLPILYAMFFGTMTYLMLPAVTHFPHSGRLWWRTLLFLIGKLAVLMAAFLAVNAALFEWLR